MKRRGIAHIIVFIILTIVVLSIVAASANYYGQKELRNSYIAGTFQGYTSVNTGSGDEYIVKISNAIVTCDSWTMSTADIYTVTHLQQDQRVTMSLACSNIAVG